MFEGGNPHDVFYKINQTGIQCANGNFTNGDNDGCSNWNLNNGLTNSWYSIAGQNSLQNNNTHIVFLPAWEKFSGTDGVSSLYESPVAKRKVITFFETILYKQHNKFG